MPITRIRTQPVATGVPLACHLVRLSCLILSFVLVSLANAINQQADKDTRTDSTRHSGINPEVAADEPRPTTLIVNAMLLDGTGSPPRLGNVRISEDLIIEVGQLTPKASDQVIQANGLALSPGFIDNHSHHDISLKDARDALGAVSQGITTIVVGQDGVSSFPLSELWRQLDEHPPAVNVASYAGHGVIRARAMGGPIKRRANNTEIHRMCQLFQEEMSSGALGLSTGLEYEPGVFSDGDELIQLAKVAARTGGRYISHIRSEDRDLWQAIDELIAIGQSAKIPVQISHMKLAMRALWGRGDDLLAKLDEAREAGVQVTADVYPYTMWQSTITVLYPKRNFGDRAETEFVLSKVASPDDIVIVDCPLQPSYAKKSLRQIAELRETDPATALMYLISESQKKQMDVSIVAQGMNEADIEAILRWKHSSVSSDGGLRAAHPRGFGAFTRVLGRYVRERRVLSLEEAIRKMTSLAASNVGIVDRGLIQPGKYADLVLFDAATVIDNATLENPHAISSGIRTVWVNGEVVFHEREPTRRYPGRALRRSTVDPR